MCRMPISINRLIAVIISVLSGFSLMRGEVPIDVSLLEGRTWIVDIPDGKSYSTELGFKNGQYTNTFIYKGRRYSQSYPYSVSRTGKPQNADKGNCGGNSDSSDSGKSKVSGMAETLIGKYIMIDRSKIFKDDANRRVQSFRVLGISKTKLQLENTDTGVRFTCTAVP